MNIKDFKKIGFDLDGTLIDSLDGIYCSYESSAKNLNLEIFPKNIIKKNIGPPIDIFFAKLYPDYQFLKNQYSILFREHYLRDGYKKTKLKDNTYFLLDLLFKNSHELFILTNKSSQASNLILKFLKIENFFQEVFTVSSDSEKLKNKSLYLKKIFKNQSNGIYVGDTMEDFNASKDAKIKFIGLKDGFGDFNNEAMKTGYIYESIQEIIKKENLAMS